MDVCERPEYVRERQLWKVCCQQTKFLKFLVFEIVCGSDSEDHSEAHAVVQCGCPSAWTDLSILEEEFI